MWLWDTSGRVYLHQLKWKWGLTGEFTPKTDSSDNRGLKDNFQPSLWLPLSDILVDYESDRVY